MNQTNKQPACENEEPHDFHVHVWMDHHFKEHQVWCNGICDWCYPFDGMNQHGPGAHK